jgi:hypothetical protein
MNHHVLETIAKYDLQGKEAAAFKMASMYEYLIRKVFPDWRHGKMRGGDPRKREAFKYCWKAITEAEERGEPLDPKDYKLYVYAQLKLFKDKIDNGAMVFLSPNCLAGKTAWNRWLLYKARFEKQKVYTSPEKAGISVNVPEKVRDELLKTKAHFQTRFRRLDQKDILDALDSRTLLRWVVMRLVSGYYPFLSPVVEDWLKKKNLSVAQYFGHGLDVYSGGITTEIRAFFKMEFAHEYGREGEPNRP